jgi:cyclopropane fatty-acyl-phospholipid synthase-like methyltransferase
MTVYQTGEYLSKNQSWHTEDSAWKAEKIARILEDNGIAFSTAVEVGCGAGQVLLELSRRFPRASFCGYDVSPDAQRFWSGMPDYISLRHEDFLQTTDRFDVLLLVDVFEHVPDYMGFLDALRPRAARHVFHIPLELSAQGIISDVPMKTRTSVGHLHYFSRTTALATLRDCGYHVIDWRYTNTALDRAQSRKARALNVLRRPLFKIAPELTTRIFGGRGLAVLADGTGGS